MGGARVVRPPPRRKKKGLMKGGIRSGADMADPATLSEAERAYKSLDDTDSIIQTIGIICALVMSFAVGILYTFTKDEWYYIDAQYLMYFHEDFRKVVVEHATGMDVDLTPKFGGKMFNVTEALLDRGEGYNPNRLFEAATVYLLPQLPKGFANTYMLINDVGGASTRCMHAGASSMFFLSSCLVCSLLIYFVLTMSDAREDSTGVAYLTISKYLTPTIYILLVFLVVGIVLFIWFLNVVVTARYPSYVHMEIHAVWMRWIMLAVCGLCVLYAWLAFIKSNQEANKIRGAVSPDTTDKPPTKEDEEDEEDNNEGGEIQELNAPQKMER